MVIGGCVCFDSFDSSNDYSYCKEQAGNNSVLQFESLSDAEEGIRVLENWEEFYIVSSCDVPMQKYFIHAD
jgi:hypothetical protein